MKKLSDIDFNNLNEDYVKDNIELFYEDVSLIKESTLNSIVENSNNKYQNYL